MGNRRLVDIQNPRKIGNAKFANRKRGKNFYPRIIGKNRKKAHNAVENIPLRNVILDQTLRAFIE